MDEFDVAIARGAQKGRQGLGAEDGAVLASGATKGHREAISSVLRVGLDRKGDEFPDWLQEGFDFGLVCGHELGDRLVSSCELAERLDPEGIGKGAAVEHISAAVSLGIGRHSALVGKRCYVDVHEWILYQSPDRRSPIGALASYQRPQWRCGGGGGGGHQ